LQLSRRLHHCSSHSKHRSWKQEKVPQVQLLALASNERQWTSPPPPHQARQVQAVPKMTVAVQLQHPAVQQQVQPLPWQYKGPRGLVVVQVHPLAVLLLRLAVVVLYPVVYPALLASLGQVQQGQHQGPQEGSHQVVLRASRGHLQRLRGLRPHQHLTHQLSLLQALLLLLFLPQLLLP
jgi:hypothetical protein